MAKIGPIPPFGLSFSFRHAYINSARVVALRATNAAFAGEVKRQTNPSTRPQQFRPIRATKWDKVSEAWVSSTAGPKQLLEQRNQRENRGGKRVTLDAQVMLSNCDSA